MRAKRIAVLTGLGLGLLLLMVWAVCPQSRTRAGSLSFTFVGLTNDPSGAILAQFKVANAFPRRVNFGVNEVQIYQTNGWPNWTRNPGGSNWFSVAAGASLVVSVPVPPSEGSIRRVPLDYQEEQSFQRVVWDKGNALVGYGLARLRGRPFAGIRRYPRVWIYSPELTTISISNKRAQVALTKSKAEPGGAASRSQAVRPEADASSAAAGSGP